MAIMARQAQAHSPNLNGVESTSRWLDLANPPVTLIILQRVFAGHTVLGLLIIADERTQGNGTGDCVALLYFLVKVCRLINY